jgi:hypothetical protein
VTTSRSSAGPAGAPASGPAPGGSHGPSRWASRAQTPGNRSGRSSRPGRGSGGDGSGPVTNRPAPTHSPRSGAHRPRRPLWHDLLPLAVVALAVVALVVGIFELKDSVLGGTTAATTSNGPSDDNGAPPPASPTGSRTASATATSTAGSSATTSATATVSHSTRISVFNATTHTGLARGAASKLTGAGWTRATTGGNKTGYTGSTTVFYPSSSLRATARAVAADLGGYAVQQSTQYGSSGLTVVLGSDYHS